MRCLLEIEFMAGKDDSGRKPVTMAMAQIRLRKGNSREDIEGILVRKTSL